MREQTPFGSWLLGSVDQGPRVLRVRVQALLTTLLITTNVVGACVVFLLSTLVLPGPSATPATRSSLAIAVPVYVVLAVLVGAGIGTSFSLRSLRWATQGREPSDHERRVALRLPWRLTLVQAGLWLGAVLAFTVLALVLQPGRALTTAFTIATAGLVVSAIAYLFSEFALRPIAARALAGQDRLQAHGFGVRQRMQVFWGLGTAAPVLGLMLTALLALTGQEVTVRRLSVSILALGGIVLLFGLLVTWLNARAVVAPILSVRDALLRVQSGDFEAEVPLYDGTELGMLQSGFNQTVAGLRERERIRDLFGRHVGREVAEAAALLEVELGGEQRIVSVLFVDLVGSTSYATEHSPAEVVQVLNRFFGVVVEEVGRQHGLVNKFIGDAVLATFGAPSSSTTTPVTHWRRRARSRAGWRRRCPRWGRGSGSPPVMPWPATSVTSPASSTP